MLSNVWTDVTKAIHAFLQHFIQKIVAKDPKKVMRALELLYSPRKMD
jgi:hypothetical protein